MFDWEVALREVSANVAFFEKFGAKAGMTFLDYGTGDGAFMARMKMVGFDVYGFDLCEQAAGIVADRLLLDRSRVSFTDEQLAGKTFDLVASREVIEHVDDPNELLNRLAGYVNPGGLLQIQTPLPYNNHSLIVHQSHHVVLIAAEALAAMFVRTRV